MLGLAVPVTASYIIAAVMVAPALVQAGVSDVAAHMFIFYYAVLSEVSPPTALSPFAAAALTGGNPFATMMLTWKYTLPAFLVPFVFTLTPDGLGILMQGTPAGDCHRHGHRRRRHRGAGGGVRRVDSRSGLPARAGPGRPGRGAPLLCRGVGGPGRPGCSWVWCSSCTLAGVTRKLGDD